MRLIQLLSWPYVRKHPGRTMLTIVGIALGVTVFVAMHAANRTVIAAFATTVDRIAGKTDLQVTAGDAGFGEDILENVQSAATVAVAVPVIEAVVESNLAGQGTLLVLGIDMTGDRSLREYDLDEGDAAIVDDPLVFLAQPDSLIVSKELADRNGTGLGSRLMLNTAGGEKAFTVRGVMKPTGLATAFGGNLAVMDVYAAQKMFGRGRTFDRIDIALRPEASIAAAQAELTALLGPAFDIQPPASRGQQAEALLAGYTMMVNVSSVFALFVGMFIIYNAFATAVTQRRSEIGVLRALGASRGQIRRLFLIEGVTVGLAGSTVGVIGGIIAANAIGAGLSSFLGELYGVARQTGEVAAEPVVVIVALVTGIATSVIAAAVPAHQAAAIDPVHALKKGGQQTLSRRASRVRASLAAGAAVVSLACLAATGAPALFYLAYGLALGCALLLAPILTLGLSRLLRPLLVWLRPVEGALTADSLIQAPRRTSTSVAALMLSIALVVAFAGVARASRDSVLQWLDTMLNPDLFVMPSQRLDLRAIRFPADMAAEIAAVPGVERVQMFRNARVAFRGRQTMLVAIEMASVAATATATPIAGDLDDMYRQGAAGLGVIVSDSLAQLQQLSLGDTIDIAAPYGIIRLPIAGIIVDYTDQQGAIFIDRRVFTEHFHDDSVNDFRVYVSDGASIADVRRRINERFAGTRQVFVLTNEESRSYVLGITAQWFDMMNVQIAVAVLVAVLGIVNSLTVSIADRRRELGVLRAIGGLRGQIRRVIWLEGIAVAAISLVLGYAVGAINLYYTLEIVRRDVAGMRLDYQFPLATALALAPIMLVVGFVAALWPAEASLRGSLVEALEYE